TVLEIIKEVFKDQGFSGDVKDLTTGTFPVRDYCVQYRETDFNFVCRLLEQEGIYFYFEHEKNTHQLVLADSYSSHTSIKGESTLPYHLSGLSQKIDEEHVSGWVINSEIQPNSVSLKDFNF